MDVVGLVEIRYSLEGGCAEGGVAGRIGGERWREIDVLARQRVAAWRPERLPVRVSDCIRVAVAVACTNGDDRPPESVAVLDAPGLDAGVGHGDVDEREHPGVRSDRIVLLRGDDPGDLVVQAR